MRVDFEKQVLNSFSIRHQQLFSLQKGIAVIKRILWE